MKKWIITGVAVGLVLMAGAWLWYPQFWYHQRLHAKPRVEWKDRALRDIARWTSDPAWLANEIAMLKAKANKDPSESEGWISPCLVVMINGEWIAYASICSKEDSRIHDIFIGRGSDGRWYYSTFHFCKGMIVLRSDEQSGALADFAKAYYLRPFDMESKECLLRTWPQNSR